jgi:GGDEF domain-containing protein
MLLRTNRLKLGCGVVMLRWRHGKQRVDGLTTEQKNLLLAQIGSVLRRTIRDIDTAAVYKDDYFLILVEGPIGRHALSSLATQMVSTFIRLSEKIKDPNAFNFHIAIWQAGLAPASNEEVLQALQTRLNPMSLGTQRTVQFVDAAVSDLPAKPHEQSTKQRVDLVAKINAIEASPSLHEVLTSKNLRN